MNTFELLLIALILDALLGEPKWLWHRIPHPIIAMGRIIGWLDIRWNNNTRLNGIIAIVGLVGFAGSLGFLIRLLPDYGILEALLAAILIAQRSLCDHVSNVAAALDASLEDGKTEVAKIVGRDTNEMDETAVTRGAIESAAENFSDGVIAPAFWFLLLGLPGILIYKIVNTADSMIGYRSERYQNFGWAAARLDDVLNLIPARLTALLICLASLSKNATRVIKQDASQHRSPNAGWPEAAMAGALNIALAGPRRYDGVMGTDPYVNASGRHDLNAGDILNAVALLWRSWLVFALLVALIAAILWLT